MIQTNFFFDFRFKIEHQIILLYKNKTKNSSKHCTQLFWYVCITLWISDPQLKQVYMREGVRSSSERLKGGGGGCGAVCAGGRARKAQSGMRQTRAGKPVTSAQAHFGLIIKESQVLKLLFSILRFLSNLGVFEFSH